MQRTSLVATGLIFVSLLTALPAFAASVSTLPAEHTQGAVTYVSGGIGQDEAQAFAAAARQYPLTLEFAFKHTPHAEYIAHVHVMITDVQGQPLLDTRSDGPFLLAKLPAGQYTVMAERQGQTLTRTVRVAPSHPAHALFLWGE